MRAWRRQVAREEATVDLTPMLDIVFILLIFFIVTSSMARPRQLPIETPTAAHSESSAPSPSVRISLDAKEQVYLNDEPVSAASLGFRLQQLRQLSETAPAVLLSADRRSSHGAVVALIDRIKAAGYEAVALEAQSP